VQEENLVGFDGREHVFERGGDDLFLLLVFLLSFVGFAGGLLGFVLLDSAHAVDKTHLAGEEGVAKATDIDGQTVFGATGREGGAAATLDVDLMVFWMNV
jgi:hypothetical protein